MTTAELFQQGRLEQTCPHCARWESAALRCSGCGREMAPTDWYPNGHVAERASRLAAAAKTLGTPTKRGPGRPRKDPASGPDSPGFGVPAEFWQSEERAEANRRLLALIWDDQDHTCVWCGGEVARTEVSVHHLIPRGWAGSSDLPSNLVIVHGLACHDEIELWTEDHGRPPHPGELGEHRRTGVIREPVARYVPKIESVPAGTLRDLLEQASATDGEPTEPIAIRLAWSPVAEVIAARFAHPRIVFEIALPRDGDTPEAFWHRHGLRGIQFAPSTGAAEAGPLPAGSTVAPDPAPTPRSAPDPGDGRALSGAPEAVVPPAAGATGAPDPAARPAAAPDGQRVADTLPLFGS